MKIPSLGLYIIAAFACAPSLASASGFALFEQTDGMGAAGSAGAGATADDAATAFFNPAGMTAVSDDAFQAGVRYVDVMVNFQPAGPLPQGGGSGTDAGDKLPLASFFFVHHLDDKWSFGGSFTQPFGLGLTYDLDWAGRYYATKNVFKAYNFGSSAAYKAADWLSLGLGLDLIYGTLDFGSNINNVLDGLPDGRLNLGANALAFGYDLSVLATPDDRTRIGLTYRSRMQLDLSGPTQLQNIGPTLQFLGVSGTSARTKLTLPDSVTLSAYRELVPGTALLADAQWMHWSLLKQTVVAFDTGFLQTTPRHWHDTVHLGVGLRQNLIDRLSMQIGASYDSSPTGESDRLPDLLLDRQIRAGIGLDLTAGSSVTLGLSYEYVDLGPNKVKANAGLDGPLSGDFDEHAHVIGLSAKVSL